MIEKFKVNIPPSDLDDLKHRIKNVRWPDEIKNSDWTYGTSLSYIKELADYWLYDFNWRTIEKEINSFPNFIATVDGIKIHFLHIKSKSKNAIPIIITHGWPGSFLEMLKIITYLSDSESTPFHLVIPSIIGFGFSEKPTVNGSDYGFNADLWHKLMLKLGYHKFGLQGGDIGAGISIKIAQKYPESIIGLHLNYISDSYVPYFRENEPMNPHILKYQKSTRLWNEREGAYALVHSTKPLSLAYGLNDSPIGLCGWIIEKFKAWSDNDGNIENSFTKKELLANVTLYWLTQTIHSSIRMYHEISNNPLKFGKDDFVKTPVGFAMFPKEIPVPPRDYIEKGFNIVHWTKMPKGGHFPALEQPKLLADDMIRFFINLK
ncbi:Pimeloyl-ACP methyl ester carboxylesterase [Maribacter sedimenticola]|uniref:Pimeloyl-ACP methyl ester carboxylesterase n=1 Tax=Maribacter sedimenticola TaxID=228956 RepID=A0ABY1SIJ7_9FLAO|nr:epoxide hydrolase family protein [Maribacter sedimenticola]SNR54485.1 Pimeloyl-ACP methyl ester carboxylesterase [Maribacter sedimenticola]